MGHSWDKILPPIDIWKACFNALKPGGFLLAFGHSRLYHRLGVQLEDSGFIIKDCLCWAYANGFPRSLNISLSIDKHFGAKRNVVGKRVHPTLKNNPKVKANMYHVPTINSDENMESWDITEPSTEEAKKWNGHGTQLKPSWEPIVLAQKPLDGNYVENVLKWKCGVLNIDSCRIPYASEEDKKSLESFLNFAAKDHGDVKYFSGNEGGKKQVNVHPGGRWPANIMWLDPLFADYDRFFMIPKPGTKEKGSFNEHDTVKPIRLIEQLVTLVTPNSSAINEKVFVLDPFMGSGTTGVACKKVGRDFIGYEINEKYYNIANKRIQQKQICDLGSI